ncbi:MAG: entericidin A/B family lipoprotein [Phycisphaeraceae bacterium]|nr:entericidin A/B family lipoprotein [Phycisphaeraceae bacterium]
MTRLWIILCIGLFTFSVTMAGCNTMRGAGEDVESAGEAIQDAAD